MSRRTITAHFTEPGEYLAELARDRALIERNLVRLTQTGRPDGTATITHVSVESSAITTVASAGWSATAARCGGSATQTSRSTGMPPSRLTSSSSNCSSSASRSAPESGETNDHHRRSQPR